MFDPQKFCEFSEKRNEVSIKNGNNILATAFKNRRLALNLTLDQVTKDICSKAYLCKFENNQITIDDKVARVLCERVSLDFEKIKRINQDNSLNQAIHMLLFNQFDQIDGLAQSLNIDCFVASNKLVELINCLVHNEFERCEELIYNIDKVRSTLTEYEFVCFGILICEYYIRTNQFIKARNFIAKFKCDISFKDLKFLYLEQCFNVYFNLEEKNDAFSSYHLLEKEFNNGFPKKREFLNKIHFLELFSSSQTLIELKDMLDDFIPEEYISEYWYTYCLCLIKIGEYNQCMQLIHKYEFIEARFVALYVYSSMEVSKLTRSYSSKDNPSKKLSTKTIAIMNNLVEKMEKNHHNIIDRNFIKLMQLELVGESKEELVNYIREIALKYDKLYQHRFYSYVYTHHLFDLLGSMTRYKEAYLIAKSDRTFK